MGPLWMWHISRSLRTLWRNRKKKVTTAAQTARTIADDIKEERNSPASPARIFRGTHCTHVRTWNTAGVASCLDAWLPWPRPICLRAKAGVNTGPLYLGMHTSSPGRLKTRYRCFTAVWYASASAASFFFFCYLRWDLGTHRRQKTDGRHSDFSPCDRWITR